MTIRRSEFFDELYVEDEGVVLLQHQAVRVSGVGPLILHILDGRELTVAELAVELEAALGAPAEGSVLAHTYSAVEVLINAGIIQSTTDPDDPGE